MPFRLGKYEAARGSVRWGLRTVLVLRMRQGAPSRSTSCPPTSDEVNSASEQETVLVLRICVAVLKVLSICETADHEVVVKGF